MTRATDPAVLIRRLNGPTDQSSSKAGAALLDEIHAFLGRFVAYPSKHAHVAHTLWVAHAHLMDAWDSTPRLAFLSPEPASGKTRALEITELLVPNPIEAINVSAAYLFRKVDSDAGRPTILFDEADTVFGPKAREHEDVRGLLNAGHRKGAVAGRCIVRGKAVETVEYPAYCAVALAGLGDLPDTILTRSVKLPMRRRAPNERVEPFRRRLEERKGHALRKQLAAWTDSVASTIGDPWPDMPAGIEDRDADVWEPLLAVANAAGGDWPKHARAAAVSLVSESKATTPSLGIRLLADLRTVFGDADAMSTEDTLRALQGLDEAPWGELVGGKPLNARGLARRLGEYGVKSKQIRIGTATLKGYDRADLWDAWSRYLPTLGPPPQKRETSETSETAATARPETPHDSRRNGDVTPVSDTGSRSETERKQGNTNETENPRSDGDVSDVSDVSDLATGRDGAPLTLTDLDEYDRADVEQVAAEIRRGGADTAAWWRRDLAGRNGEGSDRDRDLVELAISLAGQEATA